MNIEQSFRTSDDKVPLIQFMSEETFNDMKEEWEQTEKDIFVDHEEFEAILKENKGIFGKYEGQSCYVIIDNELPRGAVVSID